MKDIGVKSWIVQSSGDSSVGIPDAEWTIEGQMFFAEIEDLEAFRERIKSAFASCADESTIGVYTESEINEQVDKEDRMWATTGHGDTERQNRIPNYQISLNRSINERYTAKDIQLINLI